MPELEIEGRKIGYNYPPIVIAEIGINHEGSLETAIIIADAAIDAGAEIVKHQTHLVEDEMASEAKKVIPSHTKKSIYEIMENCALNEEDEIKLKEHIESRGAIFISTPFSRAAADRLERMNVKAYKIGSGECNNYPLIEYVADFGKPIIVSTGMNTLKSIKTTVNILRKHKVPFALLHCTNVYPTPPELVRLEAMREIQIKFPDAVVGLSDHTTSNIPCLGAVALGASILERHFTDSMDRIGPDIVCSMDPQNLTELIANSKVMFKARGGHKTPVEEEKPTINFAFASVVTIKNIKKGDLFTGNNLWVKRPGTGEFMAIDFDKIIGKKAQQDIMNDSLLKKEDVLGEVK